MHKEEKQYNEGGHKWAKPKWTRANAKRKPKSCFTRYMEGSMYTIRAAKVNTYIYICAAGHVQEEKKGKKVASHTSHAWRPHSSQPRSPSRGEERVSRAMPTKKATSPCMKPSKTKRRTRRKARKGSLSRELSKEELRYRTTWRAKEESVKMPKLSKCMSSYPLRYRNPEAKEKGARWRAKMSKSMSRHALRYRSHFSAR